jgi:hypothetical protein
MIKVWVLIIVGINFNSGVGVTHQFHSEAACRTALFSVRENKNVRAYCVEDAISVKSDTAVVGVK